MAIEDAPTDIFPVPVEPRTLDNYVADEPTPIFDQLCIEKYAHTGPFGRFALDQPGPRLLTTGEMHAILQEKFPRREDQP